MAREDLHFRLRIPEDLKKRISASADVNHRSMTAEIVARLERSYPELVKISDNRSAALPILDIDQMINRKTESLTDEEIDHDINFLMVASHQVLGEINQNTELVAKSIEQQSRLLAEQEARRDKDD